MTTLVAPAPVRDRPTRVPTRVPWTTVLPLAVVGAFGSGFWVVALRGAVGSVERVDAPFASWLRESTVLVPVYVFAVLAALTLALRWFGSWPRGRATVAALLLVVAAATVTGVGVLVGSSVYDYVLQSHHLATMPAMDTACDASCQATRQATTLSLQVRAVGMGSVLILLTNLALLGLLVALRGGRVELATDTRHSPARLGIRLDQLRLVLAGGLVGAGVIHAAVVPGHLDEWPAAGWFFIALSVVQVVLAVLAVTRTSDRVVWAALTVSQAAIVLWLVSRTVGLPFGHGADVPEPVGLADIAATALEAVTLAASMAMLGGRRWLRRRGVSQHLGRLALVGVLAVGVVGVGGSLGAFEGPGLPHGHSSLPGEGAFTTSVHHSH